MMSVMAGRRPVDSRASRASGTAHRFAATPTTGSKLSRGAAGRRRARRSALHTPSSYRRLWDAREDAEEVSG
jgi:hypothetical protein